MSTHLMLVLEGVVFLLLLSKDILRGIFAILCPDIRCNIVNQHLYITFFFFTDLFSFIFDQFLHKSFVLCSDGLPRLLYILQ